MKLAAVLSLLTLIVITAPRPAPDHGDAAGTVLLPAGAGLEAIGTALQAGWATWYDDGPGLYGAIPGFDGRRYTAQVCTLDGDCVLVTIRDSCACGVRRSVPTIIDLSPAAFAALAPLSRGVIRVTVESPFGLPATDMETP
jgi:hypothetical protein